MRKQQAEAGDIILLYGDESEALTHPYLARAWAKTGADLRVPAPGQAKKVALLGSLDHAIRELVVHTSPTKRSSDFVAHLEQLDRLYGPKPGQPFTPVVLVEDNGPIHTSKLAMAALATRVHWLTVEWLPKYAPELNDIETVWRDLKAHHLAHQTFDDIDALNDAIHQAVDALNAERAAVPLARLQSLLRLSAMTSMQPPPDADQRRAAEPVLVYPLDKLPAYDAAFYENARAGMVQVGETIVPPREARAFDVPAGHFFPSSASRDRRSATSICGARVISPNVSSAAIRGRLTRRM